MAGSKLGKNELKEILAGNNKLTQKLYNELMAYLISRKEAFGINDERIREIGQDSFLIFLDNAKQGKIRHESSLSTYIIGIAKNLVFATFEKNKNETAIEQQVLENIHTEEVLDNKEWMEIKWTVFFKEYKNLSDECRKVIRLVHKKINYRTISEKMGYASYKYVKLKIRRCRKSFTELVKGNARYKKYRDYGGEDFTILGWEDE